MGVLGCLVTARTKELAIRAAIGAKPGSLVRLVMGQGLVPVAAGLVAGLVATRWASGFAETQLFAVDTTGAASLFVTLAIVVTASATAALLPSGRAGRIDPIGALRSE
jgi:ABC-type antimicrobial peptide transport system permease subunit